MLSRSFKRTLGISKPVTSLPNSPVLKPLFTTTSTPHPSGFSQSRGKNLLKKDCKSLTWQFQNLSITPTQSVRKISTVERIQPQEIISANSFSEVLQLSRSYFKNAYYQIHHESPKLYVPSDSLGMLLEESFNSALKKAWRSVGNNIKLVRGSDEYGFYVYLTTSFDFHGLNLILEEMEKNISSIKQSLVSDWEKTTDVVDDSFMKEILDIRERLCPTVIGSLIFSMVRKENLTKGSADLLTALVSELGFQESIEVLSTPGNEYVYIVGSEEEDISSFFLAVNQQLVRLIEKGQPFVNRELRKKGQLII